MAIVKNVDMNSIPNYDTLKMTGHLTTQFHTLQIPYL